MERASVGEHELARRVQVAPKTVASWLADPSVSPRPQTRQRVAVALGVPMEQLWPDAVKSAVKLGPDREIVSVYPYRAACPTSVWVKLLDDARKEIYYGGYTNYFIWQQRPRVAQLLSDKAAEGARIRFLMGKPDSDATRSREAVEDVAFTISTRIRITLDELARIPDSGIEHRFSEGHLPLSVFRFDEQMLVTPHLHGLVGHDSPMLHLRRLQPEGLFDRFATHAEALWDEAEAA
ncbi:XRE family transcriptional regulator [Streptomyces sp. 891-h]|nr:XRE family transcriptional regulator [Streptomyces sp. 891-h]